MKVEFDDGVKEIATKTYTDYSDIVGNELKFPYSETLDELSRNLFTPLYFKKVLTTIQYFRYLTYGYGAIYHYDLPWSRTSVEELLNDNEKILLQQTLNNLLLSIRKTPLVVEAESLPLVSFDDYFEFEKEVPKTEEFWEMECIKLFSNHRLENNTFDHDTVISRIKEANTSLKNFLLSYNEFKDIHVFNQMIASCKDKKVEISEEGKQFGQITRIVINETLEYVSVRCLKCDYIFAIHNILTDCPCGDAVLYPTLAKSLFIDENQYYMASIKSKEYDDFENRNLFDYLLEREMK